MKDWFSQTVRSGLLAAVGTLFAAVSLAAEVTPEQAQTAARNWIRRNRHPMGAVFGSDTGVRHRKFGDVAGKTLFHVVEVEGGGYVVTSGDTDVSPILAFSTRGEYDDAEDNPLQVLLRVSAKRRLENLSNRPAPVLKTASAQVVPAESWATLLDDNVVSRLKSAQETISDVRVAPLVRSKWGQADWSDSCTCVFNHYTPSHAVCGCVATAFAQIMRYWCAPTASVEPGTYDCEVNRYARRLTMMGGTYDWDNMPLSSDEVESLSPLQIEAIGKLAYDVGVASCMSYTTTEAGSGSWGFYSVKALKERFGYASACTVYSPVEGRELTEDAKNAILASLDAGMPVGVGIYGYAGGHETVLDGYGYQGGVPYVHMNCGWRGSEDLWYNVMGEDVTSYDFTVLDEIGFNIHPTEAGDVVSGRILNSDGSPVSGATVTLTAPSGSTETTTSNSKGIYSFRVTETGTFEVAAAKGDDSGRMMLSVEARSEDWEFPSEIRTGRIGNKWGVNVTFASDAALESISISGPTSVESGCTATFTCTALYSDGSSGLAAPVWEIIEGAAYASIDRATGVLSSRTVSERKEVCIRATYTAGDVTKTATRRIAITPQSSSADFVISGGVLTDYVGTGGAVAIPSSVTRIGEFAFEGCPGLTSVTIPSSVTRIDDGAFWRCSDLRSVTFSSGLTAIGEGVFGWCTGLTEIDIPEGVKTIGAYSFYKCGSLTRVTIPSTVTFLGDCAFSGCAKLGTVHFNGNAPSSVGYSVFAEVAADCTAYVRRGTSGWGTVPGRWQGLQTAYQAGDTTVAITFDANGGTVSGKASTVVQGTAGNLYGKLPTAAKSGYFLAGWYTEKTGGILVTSSSIVPIAPITLHAQWTPRLSLAAALDGNGFAWESNGWGGQSVESHDGVDAARCGYVTNGKSTYLLTRVKGAGVVSFWWKVSCESAGKDALRFLVDGVQQTMISGEVGWTKVTIGVSGGGTHILKWNYTKNETVSKGQDYGWVDQVSWAPNVSLADALGGAGLVWESEDWTGQVAESHDGAAAAQSGNVDVGGESELKTAVTGSGVVTFWWKASCAESDAAMSFSINGQEITRVSGEKDWEKITVYISGEGDHMLTWTYARSGERKGRDCGWVDEVTWTPSSAQLVKTTKGTKK